VVVENVERLMSEEGLSPLEATRKSMDQITGALVGIGLVLAAVFVPMAFLTGSTGVIYRQFTATIVSAMALSVLVAIVLTPALCATLLKPLKKGEHHGEKGFFKWFNAKFDSGNARYQGTVRRMLARSGRFLLVYAALAGAIHGSEVGAIAGFIVGFLYDTALTTPFGLTAAVAALVGAGGGLLPFLVRDPTWWSISLAAAVATAGGVLALPVAMILVGTPSGIGGAVAGLAAVAAAVNLLLSIPMIPVVRWTLRDARLSD